MWKKLWTVNILKYAALHAQTLFKIDGYKLMLKLILNIELQTPLPLKSTFTALGAL